MAYRRLRHAVWMVAAILAALGSTQAASGMAILPGFDYFQTLPGGASLDVAPFLPPGNTIIGSSVVDFVGVPVGPGMTDTIVQRKTGLAAGAIGDIDAELIALSLRSVSPITIDHGFGAEAHDVFVSLTPIIPAGDHDNTGTVKVTSHHEGPDPPNAGFFDSTFDLNATVSLVAGSHADPAVVVNTETLDSSGAPFSHLAPPNYPNPGTAGNFFPGAIVHVGPHPVTFPAVVEGQPRPDDLLPPLCDPDFPDGYATSIIEDAHARWAADPNQMVIDLQPGARHCPVDVIAVRPLLDSAGAVIGEREEFDSSFHGTVNIQLPELGVDFDLPLELTGPVETGVRGRTEQNRAGTFDTEILSMSLSSGPLFDPLTNEPIINPLTGKQVDILVRQDPERPTLGRTIITETQGVRVAESNIPVLDIPYCSDPDAVVELPDGTIIKQHCHKVTAVLSADPATGTETLQTELDAILVTPRGDEFPLHLEGQMTTQVIERDPTATTGSWDVEILSMSLTGKAPDGSPVALHAGQEFGLPSPGHTTVTGLASSGQKALERAGDRDDDSAGGGGGGRYQVDSFFDVSYRVTMGGQTSSTLRTRMELGGSADHHVDSFFDVFTELSVDGGESFMPMVGKDGQPTNEPTRMTLGPQIVPGDTDGDGVTEIEDLLTAFGNFTGPQKTGSELTQQNIVNMYRQDGDNDDDRDVDIPDLLEAMGSPVNSFTGAAIEGADAGHVVDHANHADLTYDTNTGNVKLDPTQAAGGLLTGFVLKNGAGTFNAPGTAAFLAGVKTDIAGEISWANLFPPLAASSEQDLGDIFPTSMNLAGLEAYLTTADYTGSLGSGKFELDLFVVPEPGTITLLAMGLLCLFGFARRRRRTG